MIALSSFNLNTLGFELPLWGCGVIVPTSRKPKPNENIECITSAFLSKPAASPIGFGKSKPIICCERIESSIFFCLTLKYFKPGIEILFPSRDVLETTNFVVDRDAARLFYEVNLYYAAFGQEFNRGTAEIARLMQAR